MASQSSTLDLGMLCRFCDNLTFHLPEVDGLTPEQRRDIEELCKLCIDNLKRCAVNG